MLPAAENAAIRAEVDDAYRAAAAVAGPGSRLAWETARDELLNVALRARRPDVILAVVRMHLSRLLERCRFSDAIAEIEWAKRKIGQPPQLEAELHGLRAVVEYYRSDFEGSENAMDDARHALGVCGASPTADLESIELCVASYRLRSDAERLIGRELDQARDEPSELSDAMLAMLQAWFAAFRGDFPTANRHADEAVQASVRVAAVHEFRRAERDVVKAADLLRRGLFDEFEERWRLGIERARNSNNQRELRRLWLLRWRYEVLRFRRTEARDAWSAVEKITPELPPLYTAGHDGFQAWAGAGARIPADLFSAYGMFGWDGVLAGAEWAAGDRRIRLAKRLVERLLEAKEDGRECGFIWHVSVSRVVALLHLRLGQGARALDCFRSAMAWARQHESRVEYAMAAVQYAEVAELIDGNVAPQDVLAAQEEAQALLDAWDIPAEPIALQAARAWNGSKQKAKRLTEAQRSVTELAARGWTRQQIADGLGISPETVKRHQADVRGKYGVRTMEAAVALARRLGDI